MTLAFLCLFGAVVSPACLPSAPSAVSSSAFSLPLSFCLFVLFLFFRGGGGCVWLGYGVYGAGRGCGCVSVPVLVWAWVPWGWGGCCGPGFLCVCRPSGNLVAFGFLGTGLGGAGGGWSAAAVVVCLCGWSRLPGSACVA